MIEKVKEIQKKQLENKPYFIKINVPNFNKYYTGLTHGEIFIVTAATGGGKTSFTKYLFLIKAIESAIKYSIDYKCIYFALEETEDQFISSLYSYFIFTHCGLSYNIKDFNGMTVDDENKIIPISKEMLDAIEKVRPLVEQYMTYIELITQSLTPANILKRVREFAATEISFSRISEDGVMVPMTIKDAETKKFDKKVIDSNKFRTVVVDHVGNIASKDKFNSIAELAHYGRAYMASLYEYNVVYVQQQAKDKGTAENKKADLIWASIEGLANYKALSDDAHTIIGITNPNTYGINRIGATNNIKVENYGDNLRVVEILKNRYGSVNKRMVFGFLGKVNYIEPFPIDDKNFDLTSSKFLI